MAQALKKLSNFEGVQGPVLTIVMDGVGIAPDTISNAVAGAYTPTLDMLMAKYPMVSLKAHGTAVGLPSDDDMGNSEVGHNALGAGQVFAQGAKLVTQSIESGKMFASDTWKLIVSNTVDNNSTLHFLGLFSDGNVHSHIDHLKAMIKQAKAEGVRKARVHILIDGRDVGETSALDYILPFEDFLSELRSAYVSQKRKENEAFTLPEDMSIALEDLEELMKRVTGGVRPNFFRIGFYKHKNPEANLGEIDTEKLNELALQYLDENFMHRFLELEKLGIKHSYEKSLEKKKEALQKLAEAKKYFGSNVERQCKPTKYMIEHSNVDKRVWGNGTCWWWLRSPHYQSMGEYVCEVYNDGYTSGSNVVNYTIYGICPALWIKL